MNTQAGMLKDHQHNIAVLTQPHLLCNILRFINDRSSLLACHLVSWSFLEAASTTLYRQIKMCYNIKPSESYPLIKPPESLASHRIRQTVHRKIKVLSVNYHSRDCQAYIRQPLECPAVETLRLDLSPMDPRKFCRSHHENATCPFLNREAKHRTLVISGAMSPRNVLLDGVGMEALFGERTERLIMVLHQHNFQRPTGVSGVLGGKVRQVDIILLGESLDESWWHPSYVHVHQRLFADAPERVQRLHLIGHHLVDVLLLNPDTQFTVCNISCLVSRMDGSTTDAVKELIARRFAEKSKVDWNGDGFVPNLAYMSLTRYLKEHEWRDFFDEEEIKLWL